MDGWGTDDDMIEEVIDSINKDEAIALYNAFGERYGEDLMDWFADDLSGDLLSEVMEKFERV